MTAPQSAPHAPSAGGARTLRAAIIACTCSDDGVCIMCADCGHIFVPSVPLSDQSQAVDNVWLSRELWYHMCATGRKRRHDDR